LERKWHDDEAYGEIETQLPSSLSSQDIFYVPWLTVAEYCGKLEQSDYQ